MDRLIPGLSTNQYSSTAHCPLFFFFLCGYFGNSFLKGREKQSVFFNPVMWKQWREPRLRKNSTAVLQFVCLLLNREGLLSLLTSYISLSIHVSVAVWALGCPHRGATAWVKVNPNYIINTNSICLSSHTCTSMPSTESPSHITESAIAVLIFPTPDRWYTALFQMQSFRSVYRSPYPI